MSLQSNLTDIKREIQTLKTSANAKTGVSDTKLSTAVARLISGYGQSGDGSGESAEVVSGTESASGTWIAESLSYRQFIISHNLNLENPKEYTYFIRISATDKDHVYSANNIFTMGIGVLSPTTQRDRDGFVQYNSTNVNYPKGDMTGVISQWYSGANAPGSVMYVLAETQTNNGGYYVDENRIILGLNLRGCEVGLSYDWEIICFK